MTLKDVLQHFGTQQKAADFFGLRQSSICKWRAGIPVPRQYQIEVLTGGKLKADRKAA